MHFSTLALCLVSAFIPALAAPTSVNTAVESRQFSAPQRLNDPGRVIGRDNGVDKKRRQFSAPQRLEGPGHVIGSRSAVEVERRQFSSPQRLDGSGPIGGSTTVKIERQ
ncbi:hypothetical protein QBC34DRAFT_379136 [Podospora aff. communis PSN243]|uniref:Uncharacterized protein n=1 Tax=Podospora aff. communis PSN243 TaxID=3040156 RepID=A0AAV9GNL3_9PEZI|nr:hypothetical protein QBC34DRAFT_379136 [Podospora aff. communis PSN243]